MPTAKSIRLPMNNIRLLTFDAHGTIIYPRQHIPMQYLDLARRLGRPEKKMLRGKEITKLAGYFENGESYCIKFE